MSIRSSFLPLEIPNIESPKNVEVQDPLFPKLLLTVKVAMAKLLWLCPIISFVYVKSTLRKVAHLRTEIIFRQPFCGNHKVRVNDKIFLVRTQA